MKYYFITYKNGYIYRNKPIMRKIGDLIEFVILKDFLKFQIIDSTKIDIDLIVHYGDDIMNDLKNKTNFVILASCKAKFLNEFMDDLEDMKSYEFQLDCTEDIVWTGNLRKLSKEYKRKNNYDFDYFLTHPNVSIKKGKFFKLIKECASNLTSR